MPEDDYIQELQRGEQQVQQFSRTVNTESNKIAQNFKKIGSGAKEIAEFGFSWHPATLALAEFSTATTEASKNAASMGQALRKGAADARLSVAEYRVAGSTIIIFGKALERLPQSVEGATTSMNKMARATKWVGEQFKWLGPNVDDAVRASGRLIASQNQLIRVVGTVGSRFSKVFLGPLGTGIAAASLSYDLFIKRAIESSERLEKKLREVGIAVEAAGGGRGAGAGQAAILSQAALVSGGFGREATAGYLARGVRRGFTLQEAGGLTTVARVVAAEQGKALEPVLEKVFQRASIQFMGASDAQRRQMMLDWRLRAGAIQGPGMGIGAAISNRFVQTGTAWRSILDPISAGLSRVGREMAGPQYRFEASPLRKMLAESLGGGYGGGVLAALSRGAGAAFTGITKYPQQALDWFAKQVEQTQIESGLKEMREGFKAQKLPGDTGEQYKEVTKKGPGGIPYTVKVPIPAGPTDATRMRDIVKREEGALKAVGGFGGRIRREYYQDVQKAGELEAQQQRLDLIRRARERGGISAGPAERLRELAELLEQRDKGQTPFTDAQQKRFGELIEQYRDLSEKQKEYLAVLRKSPDELKMSIDEQNAQYNKNAAALKILTDNITKNAKTLESIARLSEPLGGKYPFMGERTLTPGNILQAGTELRKEQARVFDTVTKLSFKLESKGVLDRPEMQLLQESKKRLDEINKLLSEKGAYGILGNQVQQLFGSLVVALKEQQRTQIYPREISRRVGRLQEIGAITPSEAKFYSSAAQQYIKKDFDAMKIHLDNLLNLKKQAFDQEVQATTQFADLQIKIIRDHYDAIIKIARARLTAIDRQDVFRLGYAQTVAGIEAQRTGIGTIRRGAAIEEEERAVAQERFQRGQFTQLMGIAGVPLPKGFQMAVGLRELQLQREQYDRQELERVQRLGDSVDKFSNTMDKVSEVGLTPQRLMQSEAGRQFYAQQLQDLLPAASRLGFGESVGGRLQQVLDARQRFALQTMQFGEAERETRLAQSGASLEELNRQFEGKQQTPEYLYRRAELLKERRDLLAEAGRPEEAATVQKQFMETYAKLSNEQKKAITDKQAAIKLAIESQTNIVRQIYDFLTGRGKGGGGAREKGGAGTGSRGATGGAQREYQSQFGKGPKLKGEPALVGGPFSGVTPYKGGKGDKQLSDAGYSNEQINKWHSAIASGEYSADADISQVVGQPAGRPRTTAEALKPGFNIAPAGWSTPSRAAATPAVPSKPATYAYDYSGPYLRQGERLNTGSNFFAEFTGGGGKTAMENYMGAWRSQQRRGEAMLQRGAQAAMAQQWAGATAAAQAGESWDDRQKRLLREMSSDAKLTPEEEAEINAPTQASKEMLRQYKELGRNYPLSGEKTLNMMSGTLGEVGIDASKEYEKEFNVPLPPDTSYRAPKLPIASPEYIHTTSEAESTAGNNLKDMTDALHQTNDILAKGTRVNINGVIQGSGGAGDSYGYG